VARSRRRRGDCSFPTQRSSISTGGCRRARIRRQPRPSDPDRTVGGRSRLAGATSVEELLRLVADHAQRHPDGPIWAHGWDETDWPRSVPPTTDELDAVVGGRPAYLARVDVHSAVASTGLRRLVPDLTSARGYAERQPLTADAHHLVRAAAREMLTPAQLQTARVAGLDLAARSGIVAVHECAGPEISGIDDWHAVRTLDHGVDVVGYWG